MPVSSEKEVASSSPGFTHSPLKSWSGEKSFLFSQSFVKTLKFRYMFN